MASAAIFNEFVSKLSMALNINNYNSSSPIIREEATLPIQEPTIVEGGVDAAQAIEDIFKGGNLNLEPKEMEQNQEISNKDTNEIDQNLDLDGNPDSQISQKGGEIYENDPPQLADTIQNESEKQEENNEVDDGVIADPYENEESHSNDEPDLENILPSDASSASDISLTNSDDGSSSGDEMFEETLKAVTAYRLQRSRPSLEGGDVSSNFPPGVVKMHGGSKSVTPQSKMLTIINEYPWVIKKN